MLRCYEQMHMIYHKTAGMNPAPVLVCLIHKRLKVMP